MQKDKTKQIWQAHQLPLAKDSLIACAGKTIEELQEIIEADIGFPCVIKSCVEGSSRGVFILLTPQDLVKKYSEIQQYTGELLLEAFLRGEEYTVSILEREGETIALPVIAIVPPANEEFDFENKYNGKTQEICPAPISDDMAKKMQEVAIKAHKAIGARGYSRVDIIWSEGVPYLLEINTIPGFTSESLFPKAARAVGISFEELLQILMTNNK